MKAQEAAQAQIMAMIGGFLKPAREPKPKYVMTKIGRRKDGAPMYRADLVDHSRYTVARLRALRAKPTNFNGKPRR